MSRSIIELYNVSKQYQVGEKQPYYALRDTITRVIKNIFNFHPSKLKKPQQNNVIWALKNVSFKISPGEVVGLVGPNGAGKSTLLKLITRITDPTEGRMVLRGRVSSLLEVGTGFHPELTGRQNVYLYGAILGMRRSEINNKFDQIIQFAELENFIDTPVKLYSSGMYTRLAFAVASHLDSEILLIDEILAVGDLSFQKKCITRLYDITKQEGRTIIFISHNMSFIQNLCDKCILLEKGRIKKIGKTDMVIKEYLKTVTSSTKISLKNRKDRRGNGKIKITEVSLKSKKGNSTTFLSCGEDIQIDVKFEILSNDLKYIDLGINIDSFQTQNRLAFISNKIINKKLSTKHNKLSIHVKKLPLTAGKYQFTIIITDEAGEVIDWIQKAGIFEVIHGNFYSTGQLPNETQGNMLLDYSISQNNYVK